MKQFLIATLVCVNVALLLVLMLGSDRPSAEAQVYGSGNDYVVTTGHISDTWDALYIIDRRTRKLGAWRVDRTTKKLTPYRGRDLAADFKR